MVVVVVVARNWFRQLYCSCRELPADRYLFQMSAAALPTVSDADPVKAERTGREADAQSTTSADSGNGSLNNVGSSHIFFKCGNIC